MDKRDTFTFMRSYYEAAHELPDDQRLVLYDAIMSYALDCREPEINGVAKSLFILIKPVLKKSASRSKAGASGGMTSKSEAKPKQIGSKPQAKPDQNASDKEKEKDNEYDMDIPPTPQGGAKAISDRFETFWEAYPKKRSKGDAMKAWLKIKPSADLLATMLSAIDNAKKSNEWLKSGGEFIPYPASWLRADGWKDEYTSNKGTFAPTYDKTEVESILDTEWLSDVEYIDTDVLDPAYAARYILAHC